jgi:hypothetical protein
MIENLGKGKLLPLGDETEDRELKKVSFSHLSDWPSVAIEET